MVWRGVHTTLQEGHLEQQQCPAIPPTILRQKQSPKGGRKVGVISFETLKVSSIILHGKDELTHFVVNHCYLASYHTGPTLLMSLLSHYFHVIGYKRLVCSTCWKSIICRWLPAKPNAYLMGQLPPQQVTPGPVFKTVGINFAVSVYTKYSHTRKPVIINTYICVFVSFTVRAMHLEPVSSDLTTEAFMAAFNVSVPKEES